MEKYHPKLKNKFYPYQYEELKISLLLAFANIHFLFHYKPLLSFIPPYGQQPSGAKTGIQLQSLSCTVTGCSMLVQK